LREPYVFLADEIKVKGNPVMRQNSRHSGEVSTSGNESEKRHKHKRDKARYQVRIGKTERT